MSKTAVNGGARRDLYLIVGMLIAVVVTSTALYWAATSGRVNLPALLGTKNNGDLIQPPRQIVELPLRTASGGEFDFAAQKPHWTLLIPVGATCDDACANTLYLTRQIRTSLGKYMGRVQRYLVSKSGAPDAAFTKLLEQHPGVVSLQLDATAFDQLFAGFEPLRDNRYFVVDPAGWMMMSYSAAHDGKAVIADLKFLLSNSHEDEAGG